MPWLPKRDERIARAIQDKLDALHRVARRLEREPAAAADLVQETCLRAWRSRDRAQTAELGPWLFCILRNVWVDRWRQIRRRPELVELPAEIEAEADTGTAAPLMPQDAADRAQLEQHFDDEVLAALDDLPGQERLALLFHAFGDMSYHEISLALECPIGTVMSRLHRARSRLRARLAAYARNRGIVPIKKHTPPANEREDAAQA